MISKKSHRTRAFLWILIVFILILQLYYFQSSTFVTADLEDIAQYRFTAFVADDYDFKELDNIIFTLESWGVETPIIAGLNEIVKPRDGDEYTVDILISDINVSEFDCIIIPGGGGPENLIESEDVLNKIRQADSEGLVLAAICHGPLVLAKADVINGVEVTGYPDIESDLRKAGGIYIETTAIVDGNIVTAYTNIYFGEFCICIAKALGCLEMNPPLLIDFALSKLEEEFSVKVNFVANITDESNITTAEVQLKKDSSSSIWHSINLQLDDNGEYSGSYKIFVNGSFVVDILLRDDNYNQITYENVASFSITVKEKPVYTDPQETEESEFFLLSSFAVILMLSRKYRKRILKLNN